MTRVTRVGGDGLQDYVLAPTGGEEGSELLLKGEQISLVRGHAGI